MLERAWKVTARDCSAACVVFAEMQGKAKRAGAAELDEEFTAVCCSRAPAFDGLTAATLTDRAYVERGWRPPCRRPHCQEHCFESEVVFDANDNAYCSQACCDAGNADA